MNARFSKMLEALKNHKDPKDIDKKPTVYLVSNSIFIKGTYVDHDEETITISSFSCLGLDTDRTVGTMIVLLDSLSVLGSTLSIETQEK